MDYLARLAKLDRLVVVDGVQLSTAATTGAGTGAASAGGGSTGPFSGATQLSAVISARMFEAPGARWEPAAGPRPSGTGAARPGRRKTAGLNNS